MVTYRYSARRPRFGAGSGNPVGKPFPTNLVQVTPNRQSKNPDILGDHDSYSANFPGCLVVLILLARTGCSRDPAVMIVIIIICSSSSSSSRIMLILKKQTSK